MSAIEKAGCHQQHMDREDALRDYQTKVQDLRLVCRHFEVETQDGYPLYTEAELLRLVDRANQALHVVAACAAFVGRK